ncbi:MAG: TetR/AcrR family transcriptional regulator [Erysipelotrichaceae bacterium]|nr:TetR/AcrR family transcriptional regulator [Erysipelotrichaceae bacterium]
MAQILKDDLKDKIIDSAKSEFLEKGFKEASLRNIAKSSNMTVGNLYRYFKNKEDIKKQIIGDTLRELENMLQKVTDNKISFSSAEANITLKGEEMIVILDKIADEMVDIYKRHKIEFNILLQHSSINEELLEWFAKMIVSIIRNNYDVENHTKEVNDLAHAYAVSIFYGVKDLFLNKKRESDNLNSLIKIYFRSFIKMLDFDLKTMIGD